MTTTRDLTGEVWDLLIVGGGILGAGIARDATLRGLRVALVEQADFASGTSSRSTKLVHGGFRYLEHGQFALVAESCRERERLLELAPHLVHSLPFLLPVKAGDPRPLWKLRAGMMLYDRLASLPAERRHRVLSPREVVNLEPALEVPGLQGAIAFHDCQMDDARLCLETVLDAAERGARCLNYCAVTGMAAVAGRIERVTVQDRLSGICQEVRARVVINAAGPWVERIAGLGGFAEGEVALGPTKGVHLVLPPLLRKYGVYFQSPRDSRMVFLLPYGAFALLGTTDTPYREDPAGAVASMADVDYLLGRLREILPGSSLTAADIVVSFAGIRPLVRAPGTSPSSRPREQRLVQLGSNFLTIAGGKYTTFRAIAEQVVDAAFRVLGRPREVCVTACLPLPARRPTPTGKSLGGMPAVYESDIRHACRREMAQTVEDVMRRRTSLFMTPDGDAITAREVGRLMAAELGWTETRREQSVEAYLAERTRNRPWAASSQVSHEPERLRLVR